jgi:polyhydroxyalkanoate synthase
MVAPIRPFLGLAGDRAGLITQAYRVMGGAPKPLVRRAFQLTSFNKLVTKPIAIAAKLDDADFLAQVEAVDRFTANMIAYPGRTFGQLYHRILKGNQLATGTVTMDDREIKLANLTVPLLAFGGASDGIAPVPCVRPIVDLVPNVDTLRFEVVPGGHLGMLTGRAARTTTWRILDEWIEQNSRPEAAATKTSARKTTKKGATKKTATKKTATKKSAAKKTATKKAAPKKQVAKKTAAKKTAAKRTTTRKVAGRPDAIGANPDRRYSSAASRSLGTRTK